MSRVPELLRELVVEPGHDARLDRRDTGWRTEVFGDMPKDDAKELARDRLGDYVDELETSQELLWASGSRAILVVLQALDAAGKDGTIKHVMSGVNPQGCRVHSFKQPSAEELDHDFLWRATRALPGRGEIGIFNRSYYEEVLVVRVHPELLDRQRLPPGGRGKSFWKHRYTAINQFEHHLVRSGTTVIKFFLHLSRDEQRERLLARLDEPGKEWKFSASDLAERAHWDQYMHAYEETLTATSTKWAPWYVIPADHKYLARALVAAAIAHRIRELGLEYPEVDDVQHAANLAAKQQLERERST